MLSIAIHGTTDSNLLKQWEYVLSHWRPDILYWLGSHPIPEASNTLERARRSDWRDLTHPLVVLAPRSGRYVQGKVSLAEFAHPDDACYAFGSDAENLDPDAVRIANPEHLVYIPTDTIDQMYAHVACAVTLWDRQVKRGAC